MIASCGQLGLDWRETTLGEFMEAVEAHNVAHDSSKPEPATPEFRNFMRGMFKKAS